MSAFSYVETSLPISTEMRETYSAAWQQIARPGNWWTGPERVQIAAETRNAGTCQLCQERKAALSPFNIDGAHDSSTGLPPGAVDAIHRLVTDPARLTEAWLASQTGGDNMSVGAYVELLSIVVAVLSIDTFHTTLGLPLEALPDAQPGAPTGYTPPGLETTTAWVPMIDAENTGPDEQDLWGSGPMIPNVVRAMSLVPDGVRLLKNLSAAQYLAMGDVGDADAPGGRSITRAQIEFVAARVSSINDCFY
jgi:hypothetical protein